MKQFIPCMLLLSLLCAVAYAQKFDKQAHRGGAGLMPENSIPAAINAVKNGWTIEMDIYMTKDSQLVVTHDPHIVSLYAQYPDGHPVLKSEESRLLIKNMNYAEVKSFDIGSRFYPVFPDQQKTKTYIPLLSELIDTAENYARQHHLTPPHYNIQPGPAYTITDDFRTDYVRKMMNIILAKQIGKRSMFQAFDLGMLETVHRDYPGKIKTFYLVGASHKDLNKALDRLSFKPDYISPAYTIVNQQMVDACHAKGIKIIPWTVDRQEDIDKLKAMGVDGIISNYPNLL